MIARSNLADAVKESLTMDQVVRRYGFEPTRAGFIKCPFHKGDHTASLKLYPGGRGWHCFGCHKGGSVIDFVMELYGINFQQAVVRLNADFGLGLTAERQNPSVRAKAIEAQRRAKEKALKMQAEYQVLAREHLFLHEYMRLYPPDRGEWEQGKIDPVYVFAINRLSILEWQIEEWEESYEQSKRNSFAD